MSDRLLLSESSVIERDSSFRLSWSAVPLLYVLGDILAILAALALGHFAYQVGVPRAFEIHDFGIGAGEATAVIFVCIAFANGLYAGQLGSAHLRIGRVIGTWTLVFAAFLVTFFLLKASASFSRGFAVIFYLAGIAFLIVDRLLVSRLVDAGFAHGWISPRKAALIVIGHDRWSPALRREARSYGMALRHVWQLKPGDAWRNSDEIGREVLEAVRAQGLNELIIASSSRSLELVKRLSDHLRLAPVTVRLLADPRMVWLNGLVSNRIGPFVAIEISREPLTFWGQSAKRACDVVISSCALVLLAPFLLLVAIAIRLETPGPVIFRQHRDGFNGKPFAIFKFRTMRVAENGSEIVQAKRNDPRVTRIGAFLRRTSIDEIPQLMNVLRGDMSLVGPRPHAVAHGKLYAPQIVDYAHRHHVKPGITGWAQVNGSRGETPTLESMKRRVDLDVWYIGNWGLLLDFKIIFMTIRLVLTGRNAY